MRIVALSLSFFASIPAFDLKFFGRLFPWCFWKPSISLNTMRQASFGLRIKSLFLHFSAYSYCHFLFALRFSRSSSCLASLNLFVFSSEGHLRQFLKALFLFPIRSIRRFSDSENQSGLFLVSLSASSVAVFYNVFFEFVELVVCREEVYVVRLEIIEKVADSFFEVF